MREESSIDSVEGRGSVCYVVKPRVYFPGLSSQSTADGPTEARSRAAPGWHMGLSPPHSHSGEVAARFRKAFPGRGCPRALHCYFSFGRPAGCPRALGQLLLFGKSASLLDSRPPLIDKDLWMALLSAHTAAIKAALLTGSCVSTLPGWSFLLPVTFSGSCAIF